MSGINKHMIRRLLIDNPDGLTLRQISKVTGITIESCINSLKRCYGCYVSHWQEASPERKILCQVWKCVSVPKDAPKPRIKKTPEELKQYQAEYQAEYRMKLRNEQLDRQIRREAEKYKKQRAAERVKKKPVKIKEVKAPVFTSTGLTTIRGPWPTMQ